jgi:hypothetical protein
MFVFFVGGGWAKMSGNRFTSVQSIARRSLAMDFSRGNSAALSPIPRVAAWPNGNSFQQNRSERLDTNKARSQTSTRSGVLIALISQEGIRCGSPFRRRAKSGAAPATVGGESFSKMPLGFAVQSLGRRRRVKTREPGDLPEQRSSFRRAGRAYGADFRCGDDSNCHTDGGRHG